MGEKQDMKNPGMAMPGLGQGAEGAAGGDVDRRRAFHMLVKPTGAVCNLDCAYCFFLSKEMLYPGSRFRMAEDLLETYVRQVIEAQPVPEVNLSWQGGEPTMMGVEFFRKTVELAEKHKRPGMRVIHSIQTNGTLLDDQWAEFFKENNFLVGISIDGPKAIHDTYRVNKGGSGTFDKVMEGLGVLRKHGVEYNTLTTLHHANAGKGREVYRFLRDECGSQFQQYIPIVERLAGESVEAWTSWRDRPLYEQVGDHVTERSIKGEEYGRFLIDVFEEWVRRDVGRVYVQMFDVALAAWVGEPSGLCVHSKTCGDALAMEHTGDVYSCDHFVELTYKLGNIREKHLAELVQEPKQRKFGQDKFDTLPQYCLKCDVRFVCHGGCPKDRFIKTPDGEEGLNYLCPGYMAFFKHVDGPMRVMAELLRQRRAPAEIMGMVAAEDRRRAAAMRTAKRNDPCPCGSGKKFKACHGRGA